MSYYPALLDLTGKKAVVLGGGIVAQRKIETLLECGALVHIISKGLTPELRRLHENGNVALLADEFDAQYLTDAFILIIATDDRELNKRVSKVAEERNILVNTVDQPEECSFIVPSVIKRGDLIIAVSTSGKSPALAKKIREKLEDQFGNEYGFFLNLMGKIRKELILIEMPETDRTMVFHGLVDSPLLELLKVQDMTAVAAELEKILKRKISSEDVRKYIKDK